MDSTEILNEIKNQLELLKDKGYDKNSFKSGYLLGYAKALQLHKTKVSGSVCNKDDDFEPIIKHFRSEDTSSNWDDKPIGGFSDW